MYANASGVRRRPSTPARPKIGRKTRTMMIVAKTIDVRISSVASRTISALGRCSSASFARFSRRRLTTFSTSMIASSTSAPMAMAMPPSVIVLIVAPKARSTRIAAARRERHRGQRDRRCAQVRQKEQHHDDHEDAAVAKGLDHVVDGDLNKVSLTKDLAIDRHPLWQLLLQAIELT